MKLTTMCATELYLLGAHLLYGVASPKAHVTGHAVYIARYCLIINMLEAQTRCSPNTH